MTQYYFHKQGGYGDRDTMTDITKWDMIIPTSHWSADMWELIEATASKQRYHLATHFSINVHDMTTGSCNECGLSETELDGQWLVSRHRKPVSLDFDTTYEEDIE